MLNQLTHLHLASEIIEKKKYDYAIVDMRLSDGSGLELIKKFKIKAPELNLYFLRDMEI